MSELTEFKTVIIGDRKLLIGKIVQELRKVGDLNELKKFANSLETKSNKFLNSNVPAMPDRRRKKEPRFRKISPYLAFCANYRDSQRNADGKLTQNVLDVTRKAGKLWQSMDTTARIPWLKKAEELTSVARSEWDAKELEKKNKHLLEEKQTQVPSVDTIMTMKRKELIPLLKDSSKTTGTLKELRTAVVEQLHSSPETPETPVPSTDEISKMKKNELVFMAEKLGLQLKDTKLKGIQAAIIAHYHP